MKHMLSRTLSRMVSAIANIPQVQIDVGTFKYILLKLTASPKNGEKIDTEMVRGYKDCEYHTDINNRFVAELEKMKKKGELKDFTVEVLGGGKINHDPSKKSIKVYGASTGYGKADHDVTVNILKNTFANYDIKSE